MNNDELSKLGISEHTGFPNAATDQQISSLDITKLLVKNPSATFFMQIKGDYGAENGIFNEDIIVVDRSITPKDTDLVVWWENSFVISRLNKLGEDESITPWGVITHTIHKQRT